jgi:hypothetical protein
MIIGHKKVREAKKKKLHTEYEFMCVGAKQNKLLLNENIKGERCEEERVGGWVCFHHADRYFSLSKFFFIFCVFLRFSQ